MRLHSFSTYETSYNRHGTILVLKTFTSMDWAHVSALQNLQSCKMSNVGQWLWLSWKSGCFRLQRYGVRIQSSAKIYIDHLLSTVNEKTKMKKKWPGMAHFYKKCQNVDAISGGIQKVFTWRIYTKDIQLSTAFVRPHFLNDRSRRHLHWPLDHHHGPSE